MSETLEEKYNMYEEGYDDDSPSRYQVFTRVVDDTYLTALDDYPQWNGVE